MAYRERITRVPLGLVLLPGFLGAGLEDKENNNGGQECQNCQRKKPFPPRAFSFLLRHVLP